MSTSEQIATLRTRAESAERERDALLVEVASLRATLDGEPCNEDFRRDAADAWAAVGKMMDERDALRAALLDIAENQYAPTEWSAEGSVHAKAADDRLRDVFTPLTDPIRLDAAQAPEPMCPTCGGTGETDDEDPDLADTCEACNGTGKKGSPDAR